MLPGLTYSHTCSRFIADSSRLDSIQHRALYEEGLREIGAATNRRFPGWPRHHPFGGCVWNAPDSIMKSFLLLEAGGSEKMAERPKHELP